MYIQVEKPKKNRSRAVVNNSWQTKSNRKQVFGFIHNQPEVVAQMILKSYPMTNKNNYSENVMPSESAHGIQTHHQAQMLFEHIRKTQHYPQITQLKEVTVNVDEEVGQDAPPPDVESCCAKVVNTLRSAGNLLYWAITNTMPNPKVIYDNWGASDSNAANDARVTNLTWEADKIAWIKDALLTAAALIPTTGVYDTISALVTGNLAIQYSPTITFIPSSELSEENEASAENSTVVAGLLAAGATLYLLEKKIRDRVAFITPTPSDRNATRRTEAHVHMHDA